MNWSVRLEKQLEPLEKVEIDKSWLQHLPPGCEVISTRAHGASFWTRSARIDVRLTSGEEKAYFLKLATRDAGKEMVKGEYESMVALWNVSPDFVPRPIGHGTYQSDPNSHFFLCDFIDMADELPDVVDFCEKLADLHRHSIAVGPEGHEGQFGFHVTTYNGNLPQDNTWNESWEAFYIGGIKHMFALEESVHGPSPEIEALLPALCEKVIPRLLRPLETEGRTLKPCLVHGDLWDGNTAIHVETDQPYIFDSSAFWAHNEYDLAMWRPQRFKIRKAYIREYFKHFPISAPEEDWDDRNLLYSIRTDLHDSALYASTTRFRDLIITSMRQLIEKFPKGYEGPALRKGHGNEVQVELPVFDQGPRETPLSLSIGSGSITPMSPSPGEAFLSPIEQTIANLNLGEPKISPDHETTPINPAPEDTSPIAGHRKTSHDPSHEEVVGQSSDAEPISDTGGDNSEAMPISSEQPDPYGVVHSSRLIPINHEAPNAMRRADIDPTIPIESRLEPQASSSAVWAESG